ncbi:Uma2 family endonuclease [Streptomyces roseofulvus]|uniref:Uma2 family endonuclease n=1 Tax=Streptomyces roseofulvus TaxID=33902 RepID=UPI003D15E1A3
MTYGADAVLLVVEIVSPSSSGRRTDRLLKPPYYAEAGIEHLWRLELEPAPVLVVSELSEGRYVERVAEAGRGTVVEKPFPVEVGPGRLVSPRRRGVAQAEGSRNSRRLPRSSAVWKRV